MRVRMKIGPKAGEIQDIVYAQAKLLVECGQADDVDNQMNLATPKVTRIDDVTIEGDAISNTETRQFARDEIAPTFRVPHKKKHR